MLMHLINKFLYQFMYYNNFLTVLEYPVFFTILCSSHNGCRSSTHMD